MKRIKLFLTDETGAELAEYAVGTAIMVLIAIIVYRVLGNAVNQKLNMTANEVKKWRPLPAASGSPRPEALRRLTTQAYERLCEGPRAGAKLSQS